MLVCAQTALHTFIHLSTLCLCLCVCLCVRVCVCLSLSLSLSFLSTVLGSVYEVEHLMVQLQCVLLCGSWCCDTHIHALTNLVHHTTPQLLLGVDVCCRLTKTVPFTCRIHTHTHISKRRQCRSYLPPSVPTHSHAFSLPFPVHCVQANPP